VVAAETETISSSVLQYCTLAQLSISRGSVFWIHLRWVDACQFLPVARFNPLIVDEKASIDSDLSPVGGGNSGFRRGHDGR
jgi:hypothetical protein